MSLETLRNALPEYARDIKLNLAAVLSPEGSGGLTENQIWGVALSSAFATRSEKLVAAILDEAQSKLTPEQINAARAASTIMAMNNVYYRATHLSENRELIDLPARLRMNVIGKPGIPKLDFELYALGVSAINGCGMCVQAHIHEVQKAGAVLEGVQSTLKIAAVLNAAAQVVFNELGVVEK